MTEVRLATAERPILLVVDLPCPRPLQLHAGHNWEAEQWQWDAQGFKAEPAGEPVASSTSGSGRASKEADTTTGSGHQSGSVDAGRAKVCAISWLYASSLVQRCMQHFYCSGTIMYAATCNIWCPGTAASDNHIKC